MQSIINCFTIGLAFFLFFQYITISKAMTYLEQEVITMQQELNEINDYVLELTEGKPYDN